ncbi:hypothetical protein ACOSQ4_020761 [Xanthoceras sorbifolium]
MFGKLEFSFVTHLRFGQITVRIIYGFDDVKWDVLDRYFNGVLPSIDNILGQLGVENFAHDDDAVKVAYLFLIWHMLLGIEYRKTILKSVCMLVDNKYVLLGIET